MKPEIAARTLAIIGTLLLVIAGLIRILAGSIISIDDRFMPGAIADSGSETSEDPLMGKYTFSVNDRYVTFFEGLSFITKDKGQTASLGNPYTLDLQTGRVQVGNAPVFTESSFFTTDDKGNLVILDANLKLGMATTHVIVFGMTQYGHDLAYAVQTQDGKWQLYVVWGKLFPWLEPNVPTFVSTAVSFSDIHWNLAGDKFTFVAQSNHVDQVYLYTMSGSNFTQLVFKLTQLTFDDSKKSDPVISPDDQHVAYLSAHYTYIPETTGRRTPTPVTLPPQSTEGLLPEYNQGRPVSSDIYVMDIDGKNQRRLTNTDQEEFSLNWTADGQVAYSLWQKDWPMVAWLYGIDLSTGQSRRIYPQTAIESFSCTPDLLGADTARVKINVSNTGKQAALFPLEVSADYMPLDVVQARSAHRVQRSDIQLAPGESRELNWTVPIPDNQRDFLAATIETGSEFPISAAFCHLAPRRLFLPRLRWIGWTLGLGVAGYILCIPWLRHQKNHWLWRMWGSYIIFLLVLIVIESSAIMGILG